MKCADVFERLSAALDDELEPAEAQAVRRHVEGCPDCRRKQALLAAAQKAVRQLPAETVSAGFDAALRQRLAAGNVVRGWTMRPRILALAAGLATVVALGVTLLPGRRSEPGGFETPAARLAMVPRFRPAALDCGLSAPGARCRIEAPCAIAAQCGILPNGASEDPIHGDQ